MEYIHPFSFITVINFWSETVNFPLNLAQNWRQKKTAYMKPHISG